MSGIFKGDSIYKSGGGGGGYKDGGQLVDGDFIEVKNNTISSYDNVSRDPVNFYFEVKDGEILNSVVELTTAVNATVNVYVLKNGLFIPLGTVGSDTINAGDDYNLTVIGNSFILEVVTPNGVPEFAIVNNNIYPFYVYSNFGVVVQPAKTGTTEHRFFFRNNTQVQSYLEDNAPGWGLLSSSQWSEFLSDPKGISLKGYLDNTSGFYDVGVTAWIWNSDDTHILSSAYIFDSNFVYSTTYPSNNISCGIIIKKEI